MVDYCPELEETFLIDETSDNNEASKYHVVFFDKPTNVARSWMEKEYVMKLSSPDSPPKPPVFKNDAIKKRYTCLLYTSPSPRDATLSRMPSSA